MPRISLRDLATHGVIGLLKILAYLPYRGLSALVSLLAFVGYYGAKRRVRIMRRNLEACFPELSLHQREIWLKANLRYVIWGGVQTLMAWEWSNQRLLKTVRYRYEGLEILHKAHASGQGAILCGAHFTCLELIGRIFGLEHSFNLVYQKHKNPVFEAWMSRSRKRYVHQLIDRYDIRAMVKTLKTGGMLWYAPDQDMGADRSAFVDFFGIPTATVKATSRLAKMGQAVVIPVCFYQEETGGFVLKISPPFEPFPSGDETQDVLRYSQFVEAAVRTHPLQYLWSHRRFKTRPQGALPFYDL